MILNYPMNVVPGTSDVRAQMQQAGLLPATYQAHSAARTATYLSAHGDQVRSKFGVSAGMARASKDELE